jgi:hypothetical protein
MRRIVKVRIEEFGWEDPPAGPIFEAVATEIRKDPVVAAQRLDIPEIANVQGLKPPTPSSTLAAIGEL